MSAQPIDGEVHDGAGAFADWQQRAQRASPSSFGRRGGAAPSKSRSSSIWASAKKARRRRRPSAPSTRQTAGWSRRRGARRPSRSRRFPFASLLVATRAAATWAARGAAPPAAKPAPPGRNCGRPHRTRRARRGPIESRRRPTRRSACARRRRVPHLQSHRTVRDANRLSAKALGELHRRRLRCAAAEPLALDEAADERRLAGAALARHHHHEQVVVLALVGARRLPAHAAGGTIPRRLAAQLVMVVPRPSDAVTSSHAAQRSGSGGGRCRGAPPRSPSCRSGSTARIAWPGAASAGTSSSSASSSISTLSSSERCDSAVASGSDSARWASSAARPLQPDVVHRLGDGTISPKSDAYAAHSRRRSPPLPERGRAEQRLETRRRQRRPPRAPGFILHRVAAAVRPSDEYLPPPPPPPWAVGAACAHAAAPRADAHSLRRPIPLDEGRQRAVGRRPP